jgi:hypothetical protein
MFRGDLSFASAQVIPDAIVFTSFLSGVLLLAQDSALNIRALHIVQTLFCWPSFVESFIVSVCFWVFRDFERMLGAEKLLYYFAIHFFTFFPVFFIVLVLKGFAYHFSLLFFLPYSLYAFMVWHIPATKIAAHCTDKLAVSALFLFLLCYRLPFSLLAAGSSVSGLIIWNSVG